MPVQTTFRGLVQHLDRMRMLRHVSRAVDPKHQLVAVSRKVQKDVNQPLLFKSVAGSPAPIATNVFCRRSILADALGLEPETLLPGLIRKEGMTRPLQEISDAPVQEIVLTEDLDVGKDIPQVVHSEKDAGAYISAGVVIARHPDTGIHNASWNRIQLVGGDHMRIRMMAPQHLGQYRAIAERRNEPLPVAVVIGAPPP